MRNARVLIIIWFVEFEAKKNVKLESFFSPGMTCEFDGCFFSKKNKMNQFDCFVLFF